MSRPDPTPPNGKPPAWLPLEAAAKHTNRSVPTIKRLVVRGLVSKRLVPVPGKRPQAQVLMADLERVLNSPVHVLAVAHDQPAALTLADPKPGNAIRIDPNLPAALERIAEALANWPLATGQRPEVEVRDKLTWTLKEARRMTGLTESALRALVEKYPDLVILWRRRMWIKAGKLRSVLGT